MALQTNQRGWYKTPEGKLLNPKRYDANGNKVNDGISGWGRDKRNVNNPDAERNVARFDKATGTSTIIPYTNQPGANQVFAGGSKNFDESTGRYSDNGTNYQNTGDNYLDNLYKAKLSKTMSDLDSMKNSKLSALSTEKATIKPMYQQAGLQARAQSGQGARSFSEYLASKGLSSSGVAAQGEINRMGALQGTLGNLGQQETQALQGIAQRESDVNSSYASDVASAKAGNEAERLNALIQQQRIDQDRADRQRQIDAENELAKTKYADTQTAINAENELAKTKYADTQAANERTNYQNTVGQFYNDYQAEINRVQNDGDPSNDWQISILAAARQQKIRELEEIKKAESAATAKAEESQKQKQVDDVMKLFDDLGYVTPEMANILKAYGLPTDAVSLQRMKAQSTGGSSGGGIPGVPSQFTN
jgi:hypothetical protein